MRKIFNILTLMFLTTATLWSQKKEVLLHVNNEPVYASEFKRVYLKNLDLVQEESQKDVEGYLQLFIDYKLKLAEAKTQGLDREEEYLRELGQYRDQLSQNYLFEDKLIADLVKEAYQRSLEEIDASHILILVEPDAPAQDTLAAYNKIKSIREEALKTEDFQALAMKRSEEPNAVDTGGHLDYFTAFSMVYPFENAAYNTKVGEVSEIVRTRFGYHILKVHDRRKKMPRIEVSHIMISDKKGARNFDPKERIEEIATMIKQGQSFEDLAKEFSDDPASGSKGGKLRAFTRGELRAPEFEKAAYDLKTIGEISKPVQSSFGWHIIRLDNILPEQSFEEQRPMLEKKISLGDRSKVITYTSNKNIRDKYGYKEGDDFLPFFRTYVSDSILSRKWNMKPIPAGQDKTIFTIGNKKVKFSDYAAFLNDRQKTSKPFRDKEVLLSSQFEEFETHVLKEYFKDQLEIENEDYAALLGEYRDGLLIFEIMEKNIWQQAKTDTLGQQAYYERNKQNFRWKKRVDADVYTSNSKASAERVQNLLKENKSPDEIKAALNPEGAVNTVITQGVFEIGQNVLPESLELKKGVSSIYPGNGSFIVVNIKDVLPEAIKSFEEVQGIVVSNYQKELENKWMDNLRSKYQVRVDNKVLKKLKKELR